MSVSYIPEKIKIILWGLAAGRCHYCNEKLFVDPLTKAVFNQSYIAHIIADQPNGPRGHQIRSEKLKADLSNLMLLCDRHHRLIDKEDVRGHPVERLTEMKKIHEDRIAILSSITEEKSSNVVLYGANIGNHDSPLNPEAVQRAMIPSRFPAETNCIELSLKNSSNKDDDPNFWPIEVSNLENLFERKIALLRAERTVKHYSIFGIAPQPLLIKLGTLLGDIYAADVYQLKKEPPTWQWLEDDQPDLVFHIQRPSIKTDLVALKFSLSASVSDERIKTVLGEECSIWEFTIDNPNNDFLKKKEELSNFRTLVRGLMDEIKFVHGEKVNLHVFPVMGVSTAIEFGRTWNPKSQLPLILYDQNVKTGGFSRAFKINHQ